MHISSGDGSAGTDLARMDALPAEFPFVRRMKRPPDPAFGRQGGLRDESAADDAAALGAGVYLAALTVFVVQGGIALVAFLVGSGLDQPSIDAASAVGGLILLGVGLRCNACEW